MPLYLASGSLSLRYVFCHAIWILRTVDILIIYMMYIYDASNRLACGM